MSVVDQFFLYREGPLELRVRYRYRATPHERTFQTWAEFRRPKRAGGPVHATLENAAARFDARGDFAGLRSEYRDPDTMERLQVFDFVPQVPRLAVLHGHDGVSEIHEGLVAEAVPGFMILLPTAYAATRALDLDSDVGRRTLQILPTAYPRHVGIAHTGVEAKHEREDGGVYRILFRFFTRTPFGDENEFVLVRYDRARAEILEFRVPSMGATILPTAPASADRARDYIDAPRDAPFPEDGVRLETEKIALTKGAALLHRTSAPRPRDVLLIDVLQGHDRRHPPQPLRRALAAALDRRGARLHHCDELLGMTNAGAPVTYDFADFGRWFAALASRAGADATLLVHGAANWIVPYFLADVFAGRPVVVTNPPFDRATGEERDYWRRRIPGLPIEDPRAALARHADRVREIDDPTVRSDAWSEAALEKVLL